MKSVSLILTFVLAILCQNLWSQCPALSCNDRVQISLAGTCESAITPDMLLEGPGNGLYTIEIYGDADTLIGDTLNGYHVGQDLQYKVINDCGNTCWGHITLEYNQPIPVYDIPCDYIPGVQVVKTGSLDAFNQRDSAEIMAIELCQRVLYIDIHTHFVYGDGFDANGELIWVDSEALVTILDGDGVVKDNLVVPATGELSTSINVGAMGSCTVIIEPADSRAFGQYTMELNIEDCGVNPDCLSWCGSVPDEFWTVDELQEEIGNGCISPIVGPIRVETNTVGDICSPDGELVVVTYTATVESHGQREKQVLMTQAYRTEKLNIGSTAGGDPTPVFFPKDINLGCHDAASPEDIYAATGSGTMAYPYYIDVHNFVHDTIITEILDHYEVPVDTVEEMTWLNIDVDGDGDLEEVWALAKVVKKEIRDSIRLDTTLGKLVNPLVLIKDKVCNLLAAYSDEEFPACEGGKKVLRQWSIIDWCDATATISDYQTIEMFDKEPPVVLQPEDMVISIDPWTCMGRAPLPVLDIVDDCATSFDISWESPYGRIFDGYLVDIPAADSIPVNLVVADGCGNETITSFHVTVVDKIQPVVVCVDNLVVTLTTGGDSEFQGVAKIAATDFDAGSHDTGCGDVTIQAIRMDDMTDYIWDCEGNEIGYLPVSCNPFTEDVDLICEKDGSQYAQAAVPGENVRFCCEDVGKLVMVLVIVTDAHGNQNQCMIEVSVANKGGGSLVCETENIGCAADLDNLSPPEIIGGICADDLSLVLLSESNTEIGCGEGTIIREWYIDLDASGDLSGGDGYCEQMIVVDPILSTFDPYTIKWPQHYDGTVYPGINLECNAALDSVDYEPINVMMGEPFSCMAGTQDIIPVWCETDCGLIGYSVEPDTVFAGDACLKIINRWAVVDWCVWDANSNNIDDENDDLADSFIAVEDWAQGLCTACPDYGPQTQQAVYFRYENVDRDGYYTFDQVIKVVDDTNPVIVLESDTIIVNTSGGLDGKIGERNCVGSEIITATAKDFCNGIETPGEFLQWSIEIEDLDGNPVNNIDGLNIKNDRGPTATMNSRAGSPGDVYLIRWKVEDGCKNEAYATTTVIFGDEKAPSPVCVTGLTTVFMERDGTADIWAKDFNLGSFDNCTNEEDLRFSIVLHGDDIIRPGNEGFEDQASYRVYCDSILVPLVDFDMYVWDINGRGDFCTVSLAFSNGCFEDQGGNGAFISGSVQTGSGKQIEAAMVTLNADLPEYPKNNMTVSDGVYAFNDNPMDEDYKLSAYRNDNHSNGVSTLDLVLIQKHILGIAPLESPLQIIAADANNDAKVSSTDIIELRKLILSITTEFPNNTSWKFIDANFVFFDESQPWPFVEGIELDKVNADMMSEDLVGIKIGDLNESASTNNLVSAEVRTDGEIMLTTIDAALVAGERYRIDVSANAFENVSGMQFSLAHRGLSLIDIESAALEFSDLNFITREDITSISWSSSELISSQDVLFTITVEAQEKTTLANVLKIAKDETAYPTPIVHAEAYVGKALDVQGVDLMVEALSATMLGTEFELGQNDPNPFKTETIIPFILPETAIATLVIHDIAGKELYRVQKEFSQGVNEFKLNISESGLTSGVYYYTLDSPKYSATNKMIVIE